MSEPTTAVACSCGRFACHPANRLCGDPRPGMFHSCKPVDHPKGWQCPVCGVVYAPTVPNCHNAHQPPSTEHPTRCFNTDPHSAHPLDGHDLGGAWCGGLAGWHL